MNKVTPFIAYWTVGLEGYSDLIIYRLEVVAEGRRRAGVAGITQEAYFARKLGVEWHNNVPESRLTRHVKEPEVCSYAKSEVYLTKAEAFAALDRKREKQIQWWRNALLLDESNIKVLREKIAVYKGSIHYIDGEIRDLTNLTFPVVEEPREMRDTVREMAEEQRLRGIFGGSE